LRPVGADSQGVYHEKTHARVFGPSRRIRRTKDFRISETHQGIFIRSKARPSPAAPPAAAPTPLERFYLMAVYGDYIVGYDALTGNAANGPFIPIAKPFEMRNSILTATIYGQVWNYTYPHNPAGGGPSADTLAYMYRQSTLAAGGASVIEGYVPPYLGGINLVLGSPRSLIHAQLVNGGTGVVLDPKDTLVTAGTAINYLEVSSRAWTAFANQQFGT